MGAGAMWENYLYVILIAFRRCIPVRVMISIAKMYGEHA